MAVALGGVAALATVVTRWIPGTPLADTLCTLQALVLILATCFACAWWPLVMIYEWLTLSGVKAAARKAGAGRPQPAARGLSARFALYVVFMARIAVVIVMAAIGPLSQRFVTVLVYTFDVSIAISLWLTAAWTARHARTPARAVGPFVQR
jgi:phosphatidylglycerophosphate synthase